MPSRRTGEAMAEHVRVLSIDGGGIRGIVPTTTLAEVARRTGKRVHELCSLVVGASTGGILAPGRTKPGDGGRAAYRAEGADPAVRGGGRPPPVRRSVAQSGSSDRAGERR